MTLETWEQMIDVIRRVSPICRVEIGNAGEPTLNPRFLDFCSSLRQMCPSLQMLTYTNGTTLIDGTISYKDMFDAGLNVVYVDMYAPVDKHEELAKKSGYLYIIDGQENNYNFNVFEYQGNPNFHAIRFSPNPSKWAQKKYATGKLHTFLNNLDWDIALRRGMIPVITPPNRRCDIPTKFPTVLYDGSYAFCCLDFMRETAGKLWNVSDGVEGFFKYWLGKYMQQGRKFLFEKNRQRHPLCSRCSLTTPRCDIAWWPEELLQHYWNGKKWIMLAE